jgi:hypothetical protein
MNQVLRRAASFVVKLLPPKDLIKKHVKSTLISGTSSTLCHGPANITRQLLHNNINIRT